MSEFENTSEYGSPVSGSPISTVDPSVAVKGPSVFLLIAGIGGVLGSVGGIAFNALFGAASLFGDTPTPEGFLGGGIGIVFGLIGLAVSVLVIVGALKMKKLESRGLVTTAAILAMIPYISGCCLLGLPAGIWTLVVLNKPEVKSAFIS